MSHIGASSVRDIVDTSIDARDVEIKYLSTTSEQNRHPLKPLIQFSYLPCGFLADTAIIGVSYRAVCSMHRCVKVWANAAFIVFPRNSYFQFMSGPHNHDRMGDSPPKLFDRPDLVDIEGLYRSNGPVQCQVSDDPELRESNLPCEGSRLCPHMQRSPYQ